MLSPEEPVELGILNPTTPLDRNIGEQIIAGVELALQSPITILGHPVKVIKEDTTCLAADLEESLASLSSRPHLIGIIGPTCQAKADFFINALSDAGKIILSPHFLPFPQYPGEVRFSPSVTEQSTILVKQILSAFIGNRFSLLAESSQRHWFEGVQTALQVKLAPIQHVVLSDYPAEELFKLAPALTPDDALILILSSPDRLDLSSIGFAAGVKLVIFTPEQFVKTHTAAVEKDSFLAGFPAPADLEITPITAYSADAANYLLQAVEAAAVRLPGGGLLIPRQKLRQAVESQDFSGIMGAYKCSKFFGCSSLNLVMIAQY